MTASSDKPDVPAGGSMPPRSVQEARQCLSALADGEHEALPRGAELWREDAQARECWHTYHLIGDVLRSEELASTSARDAAFLGALRVRLAAEPVPLAPAPASSVSAPAPAPLLGRRLGWRAPAAVAAGFVAVGATLVVLMRPVDPGEKGTQLAGNGAANVAGGGMRALVNPHPRAGAELIIDGSMIRDARLDEYLQTYRGSLRGGATQAPPGGALSNAGMVVPGLPASAALAAPPARVASEPR